MKLTLKTIAASLFGIVFLLAGAESPVSAVVTEKDSTEYTITFDEKNHRLAKIEARFFLHDRELYMSHGASHLPKRWATFVQNLQLKDEKGKSLDVEELPGAKWKITSRKLQEVTLSYEVVLKHEDYKWAGGIDGVAFAKDWGVFYTGRTLLIMNGTERKNIQINFQLPKTWHVTAPWTPVKGKRNTFRARNMVDFSESMLFAGTHQELSVKRDGFELLFALGGDEIIAQKASFKKLAEGVLDYYIALMGGIPNPPPDSKFKRSVVIINPGTQVDGEVIGNHINMILDTTGDQQSQIKSKFIFAHEFFHLWNGKSIRVANTSEDWFKEGITSYYTLKALHHVGVLNDQSFFGILNNFFFRRYVNDKGTGKLSMRDVASGFSKDQHWGLIYGGGMFVGICQDITIRKATNNRRSLDDLMRSFFKEYGGTDKTFTINELRRSLSKLSGKDQSDFLNQYVIGTKKVPIDKCLSEANLDAKIENNQLRIKIKPKSNSLSSKILRGVLGENTVR